MESSNSDMTSLLEEAHMENLEQARLLGMSAERELALHASVEQLKRENAALLADKERLDWLERSPDKRLNAVHDLWCNDGDIINVRAAIDAARAKEAKP